MYINPYSRIFNPATGRTVNVMSKVGKNVLNGYINELQGGYDYYDDQNYDESQLGGYDDYDYQDYDENQLGGYDYYDDQNYDESQLGGYDDYDDQNYDDQSQNNMNGGSAGPRSTQVRFNSQGEPIVPRPFHPQPPSNLEKIQDWLKEKKESKKK